AEKDPKLVPPSHCVCYTCLHVLPTDEFADKSTRTPKGLGGKQAHKRFCINCGVRHGKYSPGSEVTVRGKPGFICVCCQKLQRGEEGEKHRKSGRGPNYAKRAEARRKYIVPRYRFGYGDDEVWEGSDGEFHYNYGFDDELSDEYLNRDSDM
ncbi:MAG: hypothetical protein Q9228_008082, partial [Teloschistes exilis]